MTNKTPSIGLKLHAAWVFLLLNVLFRDLHDLFAEGFLSEALSGMSNGVRVTEETILAGGIAMEIPIAMTFLSLVLSAKWARRLNLIVPVLMLPLLILAGFRDLDDYFFVAIKVVALGYIFFIAFQWKSNETL